MHVSILCGDVLGRLLPNRKKRLRGYTGRRVRALFSAVLALLLVGVTGFTPSVLRAAGAVWLSALGVWVYGPPDALTSLGVAGVLMTAGNSYAVCDVGFQLSFAAVVGTLAGGAWCAAVRKPGKSSGQRKSAPASGSGSGKRLGLREVCGKRSASRPALHGHLPGAGAAGDEHQPVRAGVRRGGALAGGTHPAHRSGSSLLGWCLHWPRPSGCARAARNFWQRCWTAGRSGCPAGPGHRSGSTPLMPPWSACCWPGSAGWRSITGYVCGWPCLLLLTAGLAVFTGNALSRDVVRVELVGSRNAPAVVISRNESAVILFRGGDVTRSAVETTLERRNIRTVECLIDLRLRPRSAQRMGAEQRIAVDRMALYATPPCPAAARQRWRCSAPGTAV